VSSVKGILFLLQIRVFLLPVVPKGLIIFDEPKGGADNFFFKK
jgi:hypothetical protein